MRGRSSSIRCRKAPAGGSRTSSSRSRLFILFQTWVQPLDGWLIDRLGPRGFITAAGLLCGLGWAGLGYATSLPMLYVLYCVAGTGAAFVYSGSIGSALKWFKERRGLAAGHHGGRLRRRHGAVHPVHPVDDRDSGYQSAFIATGIVAGRRDRPRRAVPEASAGGSRSPPKAGARPRRRGREDSSSRRSRCCGRRSST